MTATLMGSSMQIPGMTQEAKQLHMQSLRTGRQLGALAPKAGALQALVKILFRQQKYEAALLFAEATLKPASFGNEYVEHLADPKASELG